MAYCEVKSYLPKIYGASAKGLLSWYSFDLACRLDLYIFFCFHFLEILSHRSSPAVVGGKFQLVESQYVIVFSIAYIVA